MVAPSAGKWDAYQNHFRDFFADRWPRFDELISFITDFSVQSGRFPIREVYEFELTAANDQDLLEYVRATCDDDTVLIHQSDTEFVSALRAAKNNSIGRPAELRCSVRRGRERPPHKRGCSPADRQWIAIATPHRPAARAGQ